MDSHANAIIFSLLALWIDQNKSWLLQSHMAHAGCGKWQKVSPRGNPLFDHSITEDISIFGWCVTSQLISTFSTLLVFMQTQTSSGHTLRTMRMDVGTLINCIGFVMILLGTCSTGCSSRRKQPMLRINLTVNSDQTHDVQTSTAILMDTIC